MKLDFGDYSVMIPATPELGIQKNISFKNEIVIERKSCLEELSKNLTEKRNAFENELLRASRSTLFLMIEDGTFNDIINHNYRTKYQPHAFVASLLAFQHRYNMSVAFISSEFAGFYIVEMLRYFVREYIKA